MRHPRLSPAGAPLAAALLAGAAACAGYAPAPAPAIPAPVAWATAEARPAPRADTARVAPGELAVAVLGAGWPLPDAVVELAVGAGWRRLPGDSLGRFRAAGLAAGAQVTRTRRVGFVPRTDTLLVPAAGLAVVLPLGEPLPGENVIPSRRQP